MYNLETGKTVIELYDGEIDLLLHLVGRAAYNRLELGDKEEMEVYRNLYRTIKKQKEEAK